MKSASLLLNRLRSTGMTVRLDGESIRLRPAMAAVRYRDDVLRLRAPLVALLAEEDRQLARRVDGFRSALAAGRFLCCADVVEDGCCISCGDAWPDDTYGVRCDLCAKAARIVLGLTPELPPAPTHRIRTHREFVLDAGDRSSICWKGFSA